MLKPRLAVLVSMIAAAAALRLLPHPPNMTPIAAIALFGGASFADKRLAFLVPLSALFVSDLALGLYSHMEFVYASFALTACLGLLLRTRKTALTVAGAGIASAFIFFIVSDFGTWATTALYPKTFAGFVACLVAAIPFLRNMVLGDLFYVALLFGGFAVLERSFPTVREEPAHEAAPA
jgi:hypothetical protein